MVLLAMFALLIFNSPLNPAIADLGDDYFEDFEGSVFPAWEATGLWHIEDNDISAWPVYDLPSDSHYAWYGDNTTGNYDTGDRNYGSLTSDSINLTKLTTTPIELGFWSWAETENLPDSKIDRKEIFISKDGGAWDCLGQIPDSDHQWRYYGFDLTPYADSEDVKIRFSFDTDDDFGNDYRGWMLDNITIGFPRPRFDLFIIQDFYAVVGETRPIDFLAKSFFGTQLETNITIIMETPTSGPEILFEANSYTIEAYGKWEHNVQYEFKESGPYTVIFNLTDSDTYTEWIVECWWEIEEKPEEEFILWIDQDYYAGITDTRKMGFHIDSFFENPMKVNVSIIMQDPIGVNETLFLEPFIEIEAYNHWEEWLDYTFTQTGEYWVYFIVVDEFGIEWAVTCPWEIESDFFHLWIDQENYAGVTDTRGMKFHAKSYFNYMIEINISIDIMTPSGPIENLYSEDEVNIESFGFWDNDLEYQFTEAGEYIVIFSIVDEFGMGWAQECHWYIEADFFGTWINQEMEAYIGDTRTIEFNTKSYFDHGMTIDIKAEIYTPEDTTDILLEESVWIDEYKSWNKSVEYTFDVPGEYKVFFLVADENNNEYAKDCHWKVHQGFELKIDQDYKADVGDEERMKFLVKSYFDHDMEVEINITIKTPSGTVETLLHEMVWIYTYDPWEESIDYEFKEVGEYKVLFVLIDDIGVEWVEDCEWDISEPDTETSETETTSEESSSPTIPGSITPGFEGFLILGAITTITLYYRKRHA
jgi:hypothetical protein